MGVLDGKVAFVTGGGSGIGRGVCERLAADGAEVFVADIDLDAAEGTVDLVGQHGRRAVAMRANAASEGQLEQATAACVEEFGRLDIAVANAGIARAAPLLEMPLKDWQDQLDVNLTGVFLTAQAAGRHMVRLGNGGRIVCLASLAALTTGAMMWAYSATKAGVAMMVRGWAQELGPAGITVNAIGPGVIETALAAGLAGEPDGPIRQRLESTTPVGRVGRPDDIAGLVSFMAGPDAAFMTGSYVVMDGGLRDARGAMVEDPEVAAERERHMAAAMARRASQQPLLDER